VTAKATGATKVSPKRSQPGQLLTGHQPSSYMHWKTIRMFFTRTNQNRRGCEDHPEAVDDDAAGGECSGESQDGERSDVRAHARQRDDEHRDPQPDIAQLLNFEPLDNGKNPGVLGLGEGEIERPVARGLHELLKARLDDETEAPSDVKEDPHEFQHLIGGPPAERTWSCITARSSISTSYHS